MEDYTAQLDHDLILFVCSHEGLRYPLEEEKFLTVMFLANKQQFLKSKEILNICLTLQAVFIKSVRIKFDSY